jgi:hypothetical protein
MKVLLMCQQFERAVEYLWRRGIRTHAVHFAIALDQVWQRECTREIGREIGRESGRESGRERVAERVVERVAERMSGRSCVLGLHCAHTVLLLYSCSTPALGQCPEDLCAR